MKCIVMQIENGQAVLLDNKGSFITVKDRGYSIGQTIQYRKAPMNGMYATAASLVLATVLGVGGYKLYYTPVSYLSIEINPSIQLSINVFDRVIGYEYFNDDGKVILDDIKISNGKSKDSVEKIIESAQYRGYLTSNNNSVIIDIAEDNTALMDNLVQLRDKYTPENIDIVFEKATEADTRLSKDKNISIAKAKAVNEYSEVFGGNAEENSEILKDVPVKEVKEKNRAEKTKVKATPAPETEKVSTQKAPKAEAKKPSVRPTISPIPSGVDIWSGSSKPKPSLDRVVKVEETTEATEAPKDEVVEIPRKDMESRWEEIIENRTEKAETVRDDAKENPEKKKDEDKTVGNVQTEKEDKSDKNTNFEDVHTSKGNPENSAGKLTENESNRNNTASRHENSELSKPAVGMNGGFNKGESQTDKGDSPKNESGNKSETPSKPADTGRGESKDSTSGNENGNNAVSDGKNTSSDKGSANADKGNAPQSKPSTSDRGSSADKGGASADRNTPQSKPTSADKGSGSDKGASSTDRGSGSDKGASSSDRGSGSDKGNANAGRGTESKKSSAPSGGEGASLSGNKSGDAQDRTKSESIPKARE